MYGEPKSKASLVQKRSVWLFLKTLLFKTLQNYILKGEALRRGESLSYME